MVAAAGGRQWFPLLMEDSGCHIWWVTTAAAMPRKMPPGEFPLSFDLVSFCFYFLNS
jgi:hypothetical protein